MIMTLGHTGVPAVSLQYLLGIIRPCPNTSPPVDVSEDRLKVSTPQLSVMPTYHRDASKVLEKILETLAEEGPKTALNYAGHEEKFK